MPRNTSRQNQPGRTGRHHRSRQRHQRCDMPSPKVSIDLTRVRPVPMKRLEPGTVVWAHIPFADRNCEKTRPALVVRRDGRDVTLRPITSSSGRFGLRDHTEVIDLSEAGLTRRSAVVGREVTVDRIEIISICGELSEADRARALRIAERTN